MMQASVKFRHWAGGRRRGLAITGASGWIGRTAVHAALSAPGLSDLRLFGSRAGTVEAAGRVLPLEPLALASPLDEAVEWIVLHLAVAGADRESDPAALEALNAALMGHALRLAGGAPLRRLVLASSGAVHQTGAPPEKQAYAALKREQEAQVRAWCGRSGAPLLIPRIFNVGGPYMNHPRRYALGAFVLQAFGEGALSIEARRPVIRSYVHGLELAAVILHLAIDDRPDLVVETAGVEALEMGELAYAVGRALGLSLPVSRPPLSEEREDRYVGDGVLYRAALDEMGATPVAIDPIIRDTAAWLSSNWKRAPLDRA